MPPFFLVSAEERVVAQHRGLAKPVESGSRSPQVDRGRHHDLARGDRALAGDLPGLLSRQENALHRKLVQRERSRLVRGDDRAGAESLDRRQAADDHVAPAHARHADRQGDGDRHGQALGNRRHGKADGGEEHLYEIGARVDGDGAEQNDENHDDDPDPVGEALHADQQRGSGRLPRHGARDPAELGVRRGGDDDSGRAPARHHRPRERQIDSIAQGRVALEDGTGILDHGKRFPGEQRLVDLDSPAAEQSQVRRDLAAGLESHHVAGHQLLGGELVLFAAAHDVGRRDDEVAQGLGAALGVVFLRRADRGVQ